MNKLIMITFVFTFGCASKKTEMAPSAKEQVAGIQKMCLDAAPAMKARQVKKSLYERLGKEEGIRKFFENLVPAHRANKKISHLFKHTDDRKLIAHSTEFLSAGSGGPQNYNGLGMEKVHAHLNITNADFMAAGGDVQGTMKKLGYGEEEIQEVICALASFIPQVVIEEK